LEQVSLSDIELYYSPEKIENGLFKITGDECHHIKEVMRHNINDEIFVTDGKGKIFKTLIEKIDKREIAVKIIEEIEYHDKFDKIVFCLPRLKSADRFEFALEKCVELGITRFIVFESARTIAKGEKLERWQKILTAAMKQSLRAWLPQISFVKCFSELMKLEGSKIIFEQQSKIQFSDFLSTLNFPPLTHNYFIFGPEGGLTEEECRTVNEECRVKLTENRLRSETAIITAASLLNQCCL
jgi:16S rRNA (uracil1498-N3)-methyltransferase